jgi:hypothetical protein
VRDLWSAIVHWAGLEMVHVLEMRRDEHGDDRLMATMSKVRNPKLETIS